MIANWCSLGTTASFLLPIYVSVLMMTWEFVRLLWLANAFSQELYATAEKIGAMYMSQSSSMSIHKQQLTAVSLVLSLQNTLQLRCVWLFHWDHFEMLLYFYNNLFPNWYRYVPVNPSTVIEVFQTCLT